MIHLSMSFVESVEVIAFTASAVSKYLSPRLIINKSATAEDRHKIFIQLSKGSILSLKYGSAGGNFRFA